MQYLTVIKQNLKLLKNKTIFTLLFFCSISLSYAQELPTIALKNTSLFSIDRHNNLYYVDRNQDVKKYKDTELIYSSNKRKQITHIEAWNNMKIFLFNREFQEYTFLDRFLTQI